MIPGQFDYVRPASLDEALRILRDREGEAKLLSGGYSLIPLHQAPARPAGACSSTCRPSTGLDGIVETDDDLVHRRPGDPPPDPRRRDRRGPLPGASSTSTGGDRRPAGPQLGHDRRLASPTPTRPVDWPAVLLAIERHDRLSRARTASATIAARDFFLDTFTTAIEPTEVLTEIRIPRRPRAPAARTRKLERRVGDFATVGVAAVVRLGDGRRDRARRHRRDRRRRVAVRGDRRRGRARRPARRPTSCSARPARPPRPQSQPGRRRPRTRRLQAGDGRRDDRPVAPLRRRARARVRVGDDDDDAPSTSRVTVNGEAREADVEPRLLLVHLLRDDLRADRHPHRLRHEQLRRVHRPRRRRERQVVHDARRPGRRPRGQDHRGHGRRRHPPPAPAGVLGPARPPVRLLHAGDDHAGRLAARAEPGPDRGGDPRGDQRQPVPLHRLREHRQGDPAGGRRAERERVGAGRGRRDHRRPGVSAEPAAAG